MLQVRQKQVTLSLLSFLVVAYCYLMVIHASHLSGEKLVAGIQEKILAVFYLPLRGLFEHAILAVSFWSVILLTLCLQRVMPARPAQKIFSVGLAHDSVWFFYQAILHALIVTLYVDYLIRYYDNHFASLTVTSLNQSPGWLRFLFALLLLDFLYWAQHFCNHKVPFLWQFHSLHHSQKELNFFTDFRYHPLEYFVRQTFLIVPFLLLKVDPPTIVAFAILQKWYSRFYHGNIRTNLGPLRYILVTPQSHRVHHSLEAGYRDTNFGALFSVWDLLLGTQCKNFDVYPETGIEDEAFPHEQKFGLKSLILTPLHQILYPFSNIARPYVPPP